MTFKIDYPELVELAAGSSHNRIILTIYYAALLRYSTQDHLQELVKSKSIATKKKLQVLCDHGYLVNNDGIFTATYKSLDFLEKQGYNRKLLPSPAKGAGVEIYNSDAICKLLQRPFYRSFLYPNFNYLMPDGLLVLADGDRYQLNFIEIEAKKPKWAEYLEAKRVNYERLARDEIVYRYWQGIAPHVGLPCPPIEQFKFSVMCIGGLNADWPGWTFKENV